MPSVTDQGVCIRVWDWSETSQTLSLLTRAHGVLRCLAKGSKREHAGFSGGIELLTRGEVVANLRPPDAGGGLTLLTAWDLQELFPGARRSLRAFRCAMAQADLVHHAILERDPHPEVFDALVGALRGLDEPGRDLHATARFAWILLERTGHRPELNVDAGTGIALPGQPVYSFDPRRGVLFSDAPDADAGDARWRVRQETVDYLRTLDGKVGGPRAYPDAVAARALRLLLLYFREASGREAPAAGALLRSLESSG